ncbi:MAG: Alpha-galactosidase (Melibiase) [Candidatus Kaiserbacteria bacterium GW2011_GWB1_52_6]|uniref:Alpha-galactosidase (Melibiase) n=2 Tax=Candidatus Kaiseribacteriota TaxID=1752734 RepID=A0A0G1ZS33_9BACT|nr:MAG: Alpha-galactosidase (Melibiase) [Candidatus Kaiserbacteria bacterium GW2011_GWB1_52_6]KKW31057.1 MAG: Alpha-galactosidase (Melibiase) [Candidatus Kaiserbacteria bacterium GW2011_GWC2_52_8b]
MAKVKKIVVVGAGSMCFGGSIVKDLAAFARHLRGSTVVLVDINEDALRKIGALMHRVCGKNYRIEQTTELAEALPGAEFVLNSVAVSRNEMWRHDFEIPIKHGLRQSLGENGGPGGVFFTMRTIPLVVDIARRVSTICPKALLINYSNPESRIVCALGRLFPQMSQLGLCHGIFIGQDWVASVLGRKDAAGNVDKKSVDVWGYGVNHFQWLMDIRDHKDGRDLYPELREAERRMRDERAAQGIPHWDPIATDLFREFGYWPTVCSTHIGEFLPYGAEYEVDFSCIDNADQQAKWFWDSVNKAIDPRIPLDPDWRRPSGEQGVVIIDAIVHNRHTFIESGVVYNRGALEPFPYDCAVEMPILADASGVHPVALGRPFPTHLARKLMPIVTAQQFAVDAAIAGTREAAWQAFVSDPIVHTHRGAIAAFDELWEINKQYIRPCD